LKKKETSQAATRQSLCYPIKGEKEKEILPAAFSLPYQFNPVRLKRYPPKSIKESKSGTRRGHAKKGDQGDAANGKKESPTSGNVKREVVKKWCSARLVNKKLRGEPDGQAGENVADAVAKEKEESI